MLGFGTAVLKWLKSPMPRARVGEDKGALRPLLAKARAKARGHIQRQRQQRGESLRTEARKPVADEESGFGGYQILVESGDTFQVVPLLLNFKADSQAQSSKCKTLPSNSVAQHATPTDKHIEESIESILSSHLSDTDGDDAVFTPITSEEEIYTPTPAPTQTLTSTPKPILTPTSAPAVWFGSRKDGSAIQHFEMVKALSESHSLGNYVDIMRFRPTADLFVVKTLRIRRNSKGRLIEPNEVRAHRGLKSHPNIVEHFGSDMIVGFHRQQPMSYVFLEHCTGGDLGGFINNWKRSRSDMVPEMFVLHVLQSLISAVAYLHEGITFVNGKPVKPDNWTPLVHRDIKPANVFLRWPANGSSKCGMPDVVLGDLGFLVQDVEDINKDLCGTPNYLPPEVEWLWDMFDDPSMVTFCNDAMDAVGGRIWRAFGDIYAIGLVVAELATMSTARPVTGLFDSKTWRHEGVDRSVWTTIGNMLAFDPRDRPQTASLAKEVRGMNGLIAFMHLEGRQMPKGCWRPSMAPRPGVLSSSSYSSYSSYSSTSSTSVANAPEAKAQSPIPCTLDGRFKFAARPSSRYLSVSQRNVDPKGDLIRGPAHCYCPNHRSISLREPRSGCYF